MVDTTGVGNAWVFDSSYAFTSRTASEGINLTNGQIANISIVDMGALNETLAFFAQYSNGCPGVVTCPYPSSIETAEINQPLSALLTTPQTDAGATQGTPTILINGKPPTGNPPSLNLIGASDGGGGQLTFTQFVSPPSGPGSIGSAGQWSASGSNLYAFDPGTSLWMKITGLESWASCPPYQDYANFVGTSGTAISSYTSLCALTFTNYTNSGVTSTIPTLSGAGSAMLASGTYGAALDSLTPSSANYTVSLTCTLNATASSSEQVVIFARALSGANTNYQFPYGFFSSDGSVYVVSAGSATLLSPLYPLTWTVGATHTMSLKVTGTSITPAFDGVAASPLTDSTLTAAGQAGFRITPNVSCSTFTVQ
jgi:hypothetical protein